MVPDFLIDMLEKQYGKDLKDRIIDGFGKNRKVSFRVNTLKTNIENVIKILSENNISYKKVLWCDEAFIIENVKEDEIRNLDIYKNGEIYMQSLSSMLPPIILNPKENMDILDMTAAPGGKTTQIATICNNNSRITAVEMNKIRSQKLKYNIEKQGASSVYVMEQDARKIDDFFSFLSWFINNTPRYHSYNIVSGRRTDLLSLANMVKQLAGSEVPIYVCRPGFANEYTASNKRLIEEYGVLKLTEFKVSIQKLINYYKSIEKDIDLYSLLYQ